MSEISQFHSLADICRKVERPVTIKPNAIICLDDEITTLCKQLDKAESKNRSLWNMLQVQQKIINHWRKQLISKESLNTAKWCIRVCHYNYLEIRPEDEDEYTEKDKVYDDALSEIKNALAEIEATDKEHPYENIEKYTNLTGGMKDSG